MRLPKTMTQTKLLALLPLIALVFGFLEYGPGRGPAAGSMMTTLHALLSLTIVVAWFRLDARRREYRSSIVLTVAMVCLTVFALPYYLLRSRGFAGGLKSLGLCATVFIVTMAAYRMGSLFA